MLALYWIEQQCQTNTAGFEEVSSGQVRFRTSNGVDDRHDDFEEVTVLRNIHFTNESVTPDTVAQAARP